MGKTGFTERNAANLWLSNIRPNSSAPTRMFCVPYAGGGAHVFQGWPDILPSSIEVWAVNLPGRGKRLMETPFLNLPSLVAALMGDLSPLLDKPFVLFGHSMGALICYEIVRSLKRATGPMPMHLFVSACFAPHLPDPNPIHHLADEEFVSALCRLGGMPKEVLQNQELMELILPSLRADFTATETYVCDDEPPLPNAISVFGGWRDPLTTQESLEAWRIHTTGYFSMRMFPGDHFFIHSAERVLLDLIVSELRQSACRR
jgi:medium-chain acyl-[acyl-carrier-protein] hydrolase